jgi:hypothetical protein
VQRLVDIKVFIIFTLQRLVTWTGTVSLTADAQTQTLVARRSKQTIPKRKLTKGQ